ncbi:DJ-1/PfpI family protein [Streptomyces sp. NBC_01016]|uniref:DJ-1/PfpI family protein n=1 Tax=Streptomyces sp. NBC_01016 TaxID=2903720 RepID=UPI00224E11D4|nr:DJ-1/PfpI family protein [Streptomyces sp. NBC_01016]MCX4835712.1 DJ-1/PfpI family protein [Streptomyces sp. NBC_01016]
MHIQIVLFDGFDPLDVVTPFEVLHAGAVASGGAFDVELVSAEGPREVVGGTGGLALRATAALDPARADIVVVPGASGPVGDPGGTPDEGAAEATIPVLLGRIEGRPATSHHLGLDLLEATGARPVRARVVDDGDLVTGAGVTSGLDLGLHLLEREVGPQIAHAVEELFAYERRGTVWRAQGPAPAVF